MGGKGWKVDGGGCVQGRDWWYAGARTMMGGVYMVARAWICLLMCVYVCARVIVCVRACRRMWMRIEDSFGEDCATRRAASLPVSLLESTAEVFEGELPFTGMVLEFFRRAQRCCCGWPECRFNGGCARDVGGKEYQDEAEAGVVRICCGLKFQVPACLPTLYGAAGLALQGWRYVLRTLYYSTYILYMITGHARTRVVRRVPRRGWDGGNAMLLLRAACCGWRR